MSGENVIIRNVAWKPASAHGARRNATCHSTRSMPSSCLVAFLYVCTKRNGSDQACTMTLAVRPEKRLAAEREDMSRVRTSRHMFPLRAQCYSPQSRRRGTCSRPMCTIPLFRVKETRMIAVMIWLRFDCKKAVVVHKPAQEILSPLSLAHTPFYVVSDRGRSATS